MTVIAIIGAVVGNKRIEEVPLNGRQFQNLALLVPGTTDPAQGSSLGFRGGINVAGTRAEMTGFTLDGVDIVENLVKALSFKPSVDMIEEFKVDTSTYSAEYGRTAGGQVRATTKSGTNQLHGTLFEFVRNSAFDAKNFFDSATAPIPGFRRNNFGGTAGGPIVKNRTFIFGAYEGLISRQAQTRTAWRCADHRSAGGEIFQGSSSHQESAHWRSISWETSFPASLISPVSANIIKQYPAPNLSGSSVRNYLSSPTDVHNIHQFTVRLDHRLSDKDNLSGRYSFNNDFELDPFDVFSGITNLPAYGRDDYQRAQSATASDTHVFGQSLIGQLTLGYNRFKQIRTNVSHENWPAIWGIQGTTTNLNEESGGVPAVLVTGYDSIGKSNLPSDRVDTTYQLIANLTYNRGNHTLKFGADGNSYSTMRLNNGGGLGSYTFSGQYSGNSVADLLLGYPSKASRALGDTRNPMFNQAYAAYLQDDWKVTRSLTFNLGVRYDILTPLVSANDRMTSFDPATGAILLAGNPSTRRDIGSLINPSSPAYNASLAQLAKNITIVNLGTRNTYTFSKHDFAPRVGLAYRLFGSNRVVLRTGYGIFYNELLGQYGQTGWNSFPYFISQTFNGNPTVPNLTIANPFASSSAAATISPAGVMAHYKTGYVQSYNFGTGRLRLPGEVVIILHRLCGQSVDAPALDDQSESTKSLSDRVGCFETAVSTIREHQLFGTFFWLLPTLTHSNFGRRSVFQRGWNSPRLTPGPNRSTPWAMAPETFRRRLTPLTCAEQCTARRASTRGSGWCLATYTSCRSAPARDTTAAELSGTTEAGSSADGRFPGSPHSIPAAPSRC